MSGKRLGSPANVAKVVVHCAFSALVGPLVLWPHAMPNKGRAPSRREFKKWGNSVKKVALAMALVVAALSLGGCFVGKGKAPAPIITKG